MNLVSEELANFYKHYPVKILRFNNKSWEYIVCGTGKQTFVILPGCAQIAQSLFQYCYHETFYPNDLSDWHGKIRKSVERRTFIKI